MSDVEWESPAPDRRGKNGLKNNVNEPFRQALRSRPGEWAVYRRDAGASVATGLKRRDSWAGFEIVCRKQDDARFTVYARYIGGES